MIVNFVSGFMFELMYISKVSGQVSLISMVFSCLCCCHKNKNHKNQFFHLYQQNKSPESKVKFRQASNRCKRGLKAAKLAYGTTGLLQLLDLLDLLEKKLFF